MTADTVTAGNAFNPQISLILDGNYYHDGLGGDGSRLPGQAFQPSQPSHDHEDDEHGGLANGFNVREVELAFSATVDPYFDAGAYLAFDDAGGVELEEAWFQTRALPQGLKVKAGRFFSEFGYINRQHPHQWDFVDQNLPYLNLLGDHGLRDNGIQLTWLPDLPVYTLIGAELLQGDQERFGSFVERRRTSRRTGLNAQKTVRDSSPLSSSSGPISVMTTPCSLAHPTPTTASIRKRRLPPRVTRICGDWIWSTSTTTHLAGAIGT